MDPISVRYQKDNVKLEDKLKDRINKYSTVNMSWKLRLNPIFQNSINHSNIILRVASKIVLYIISFFCSDAKSAYTHLYKESEITRKITFLEIVI